MKQKNVRLFIMLSTCFIFIFTFAVASENKMQTIETGATTLLSNEKIEWGIKRGDNHEQPDLGAKNKTIIDKYSGIAMGNKEKPYVYLTFDGGYEAGYTEKILEVLKQNNVKATFFITGHYLNTRPDLVKRMIDEGHIVGNHTPISLMSGNNKNVKCQSNSLFKAN